MWFRMISLNFRKKGRYIIRFSFWKVDVYDQPRCWRAFIYVLYVSCFSVLGFGCSAVLDLFCFVWFCFVDCCCCCCYSCCCCCCSGLLVLVGCCWLLFCCCFCYYVGVLLLLLLLLLLLFFLLFFCLLFCFCCYVLVVVVFVVCLFKNNPTNEQKNNKDPCFILLFALWVCPERCQQPKTKKIKGLFHSSFVSHPCCVFFIFVFHFSFFFITLSLVSVIFFVSFFLFHLSSIHCSSLPCPSNLKEAAKAKKTMKKQKKRRQHQQQEEDKQEKWQGARRKKDNKCQNPHPLPKKVLDHKIDLALLWSGVAVWGSVGSFFASFSRVCAISACG